MSCAHLVERNPDCTLDDVRGASQRTSLPLRRLSEHLQGNAGGCSGSAPAQEWRRHMSAADSRDGRTVLTGIVGDTLQSVTRNIPAEEPPELPPNAELRVIGKPVNRVDAVPKVTGKARYTYDVQLPGMLYARIVQQHGAARPHQVDRHVGCGGVSRRQGRAHSRSRPVDRSAARSERGSERALSARSLQRPADRSCRGGEHARGESCRETRAHRIRAHCRTSRASKQRCATMHRSSSPDRRSKPRLRAVAAPLRACRRKAICADPHVAASAAAARRRAARLRTGRSRRHARISHAGADAHADGDARSRRGLARRGADALRLDAVHAQRARRSGGRVQAAEGKDPRDQRVHRRRLRREVRHRQLRRARDSPVAQGARAGAAHARSARGARQRRQSAEQPPARQARREARRHA